MAEVLFYVKTVKKKTRKQESIKVMCQRRNPAREQKSLVAFASAARRKTSTISEPATCTSKTHSIHPVSVSARARHDAK
jgi:hypothetical protein